MKIIFSLILFLSLSAHSQTSYTWTGSVSSVWSVAANWTPAGVPGTDDHIQVVSAANACTLDANRTVSNITVTSGTLNLGGYTLTGTGAAVTLSAGTIQNGNLVSTATATITGMGAVTLNCNLNVTSSSITIRNATFNGTTAITKTGTVSDNGNNNNTFNGAVAITNNGSGSITFGTTNPDVFNGTTTIVNNGTGNITLANNSTGNYFRGVTSFINQSTGAGYIYVSNASAGTVFDNNIIVSATGGNGIHFCTGGSASATLTAGHSISIGGAGFSQGTLAIRRFTQQGTMPLNLALTGTAEFLVANNSQFHSSLTVSSPNFSISNSVFNNAVVFTKTDGTSTNAMSGGNVFNSTLTVNYVSNTGNGYWSFANANPDIYNGDVYSNNNSLDRIIFGHGSAGNQFNGDFILTQTGSSVGTALTWNTGASCVMAAGKTIRIGAAGMNTGYFYMQGITQLGTAPINLHPTGNTSLYLGIGSGQNYSVINGPVNASAANIYITGTTFNNNVVVTKTGGVNNHNEGRQNIFNGTLTINQESNSGYLMLGYQSSDRFNEDVIINAVGSGGINLGWTGGYGNPEMAAGKTVRIGAAGFHAGNLQFGGFRQLGNAPIALTLTGTAQLIVQQNDNFCEFGGPFTVEAPDLFIRGGIFNSSANFTKTGGTANHNSSRQNIFNGVLTINQQSNTGYFMLGYNSNDLFNDNVVVNSTGSGGINLGWTDGTGTPTMAAGKTISVGAGGFSAGYLRLGGFTQLGSEPINLSVTSFFIKETTVPCTIGGDINITANNIYLNGGVFQRTATFTKVGGSSNENRNNIFNGTLTINQQSAEVFHFSYYSQDQYNGDVVVTSTNTGGIFLGVGNTSTPVMAAGRTIAVGASGFSNGFLSLNGFTQLGAAPMHLLMTGASTYFRIANNSVVGGNLSVTSPDIYLDGATFNGTVSAVKTGDNANASRGGNVFNQHCTIVNNGGHYFLLGNSNPDIWNSDVTFNNNGSNRILIGWASAGNQFNGDIDVNTAEIAEGIYFCGANSTATAILAAGKTIRSTGGFRGGYLVLRQFTQLGNAPVNLSFPSTASYIQFGPSSAFGGNVNTNSPGLFYNSTTFSGTVTGIKSGAGHNNSLGGNVFNGTTIITNEGSGQLLMANSIGDTFNGATTFNNTGSANMYVAYNGANNVFNGVATFNNAPATSRIMYIGNYAVGTAFNENIILSSTGSSQGVYFCFSNTTATATLAAGKTLAIGAGGFTSGSLILKQFTQLGTAAIALPLATSSTAIQYGPASTFGGNVTSSSGNLYFRGVSFSGVLNATKTSSGSDVSTGNNIFNTTAIITNSGSGYLMMGNGNADQFFGATTFNNTGTSDIFVAHNSTGNVFDGITTFNNAPSSTAGQISVSANSMGTLFNNNIVVTSVSGGGINFCSGTAAAATLASGRTIAPGGAGFSAGTLSLRQFTQLGAAPINIAMTGTGRMIFGPLSTFGGAITTSSPTILFNGAVFHSTVNSTKTGTTNDQSVGDNTFNGATSFINNGTGAYSLSFSGDDHYNAPVTFVRTNSGAINPNFNALGYYASDVIVSAAAGITFGSGIGTAVFNGSGTQSISSPLAIPVFSRMVINNSGSGVHLNNAVNVSRTLQLTSGRIHTTNTNILTMLNSATVAAGDALSTSYINGPMRYQKGSSGSTALNFPVGKGAHSRPVVLTVAHTNNTTYTYHVELHNVSAASLGYSLPVGVDKVSSVRYYTINRIDGAGNSQPTAALSGNQQIEIFFGADDITEDGYAATVVKNTPSNTTAWTDIGGALNSGGTNMAGSISSTSGPSAFNSFSDFAIAFRQLVILADDAIQLETVVKGNAVELVWKVTANVENSGYAIERSQDGIHFDGIGVVSSDEAGQQVTTYKYTDVSPKAGKNMYRVKQLKYNGKYIYSNVALANLSPEQKVSIYPNPSRGSIRIAGLSGSRVDAQWIDAGGRVVLVQQANVSGGIATLTTHLRDGIYVLAYRDGNGDYQTVRILIQK